jgi:5-methylcytosine-specific restriction endonuclease McrA
MKNLKSYSKSNSMILVLNADFLPINVTTFKQAFKLVWKGKAEIVEDTGICLNTNVGIYNKPSVIRLVKYAYVPHRKIILSRENIFKRDDGKCGYCNSTKNLTLDHIKPKSKGGLNTWENLVTCCFSCNSKKGDRTPEQAGMKLLIKPFRPNSFYFISRIYKNKTDWHPYLMFKE